eukprot:10072124-Karenia_brevis.AAC.1
MLWSRGSSGARPECAFARSLRCWASSSRRGGLCARRREGQGVVQGHVCGRVAGGVAYSRRPQCPRAPD